MSIFDNVKSEDTVFSKLMTDIADFKSKNKDAAKLRYPKDLIRKCVSYVEDTRNMTKMKFSERSGLSYATIQAWVTKYGKPSAKKIVTSPRLPEMSVENLFGNLKPVVKDASSKEPQAIIKYPDGLEIQFPISHLASVLKSMKG